METLIHWFLTFVAILLGTGAVVTFSIQAVTFIRFGPVDVCGRLCAVGLLATFGFCILVSALLPSKKKR